MEKTTFKNASEDAYVSGLLWREEEPSLPNNYEMAKRLQSLEKKFESCPEVWERDAKSIQDNIEKGYVKKLSEEEGQCDSKVTSYLPHRFVINLKKPDRLRRAWPEIWQSAVWNGGSCIQKKIPTTHAFLHQITYSKLWRAA